MKILPVIFSLILVSCTTEEPASHDITIQLKPETMAEYSFPSGGPVIRPQKADDVGMESITRYPAGMTVKYTYVLQMQKLDKMYKDFCADDALKQRWLASQEDIKFEDLQKNYTTEPVDYFITVCMLEDAEGNSVIVADENNDEDLSNDTIHQLIQKASDSPGSENNVENTAVEFEASFEYYDGKSIQQATHGVKMCQLRNYEDRGYMYYASTHGYFGNVEFDGTMHKVAVIKNPDIEFSKYDYFWVDVNHNNTFDRGVDIREQLYLPMTINARTYKLKNIGRFDGALTLEACDLAIAPPVAIGLPAPDFTETCYDSTSQVTLSEHFGKFVMLNFWSCDGSYGLKIINKVYQEFKDRSDFQIISIGPYGEQYLRGNAKDIPLNWPHVHGLVEVNARTLFQCGSKNTTFLIGPDGKILEKREFAQAKDLIAMMNAHWE